MLSNEHKTGRVRFTDAYQYDIHRQDAETFPRNTISDKNKRWLLERGFDKDHDRHYERVSTSRSNLSTASSRSCILAFFRSRAVCAATRFF